MTEAVRFLHTADWQLGMTRHFLDADAQPRYTAARIDAIGTLADLARRESCSFVLVCGDVFESRGIAPRVLRRAAERLAAFDVPVLLLPGNHDPLDAASIYRSKEFLAAMPGQVRVLDRTVTVRPGVEVVAAPWPSKHPAGDLVARAVADLPADGTTRIVAGHGKIDVLSADRTDPTVIRLAPLEEALADGRISFVALGDRHSATSVGGTGRIHYSGTPVATDYDEVDPNLALVVGLAGATVTVDRHPVGTWTFADLTRRLDGRGSVDALLEELRRRAGKDTAAVRLSLTGMLSLAERAAWETGLADLRQVYAAIEVWTKKSDLQVRIDQDDWAALAVEGYAGRALAELTAVAAGSGGTAEVARDALALAHRLAGSRA